MQIKYIFSAVLAVITAVSLLAVNAMAAERRNTVYISTEAVSDDATEYAEEMFSELSGELVYLGLSSADAKSAAISDGFVVKSLDSNTAISDVIYYPVVSGGKISAMLIVTCHDGEYGYQLGKNPMADNLNDLETSYGSPAEIYVSDNASYAVTSEEVVILSYGLVCDTNSIEKETAQAAVLYKKSDTENKAVVSYGGADGKLTEVRGRLFLICDDGGYAVGWQNVSGNNYYFRENGSAVVKNTVIDGLRYTFGKDGVCKGKYLGWVKRAEKYYYYKNGEMKKNCWLRVKGRKTYYLTSDGSRAVGMVKISGKTYNFDESGKLQ